MSLTSYRAAPPRDKPLRALPENQTDQGQRLWAPIKSVRRLPEKASPGECPWVRAVCTNAGRLWKGPWDCICGFYRVQKAPFRRKTARQTALARSSAKAQLPGPRKTKGNAMDQSLKSPGQSALEDAFHAMFELSRTAPAPTLEQRLDRLARLRAVVSENETRFEQAISADFGPRSTTETTIAA